MSGLWDAIDATWAAPRLHRSGPFTLREGQGGGQRVSAATTLATPARAEIRAAADAMRALGQRPLFMVRGDQDAFDAALADEGYEINDPVVVMDAPIDTVAQDGPPRVSAFPIWPPLQIMREIWAEGGVGPARLNIMEVSCSPKTAILGRVQDRAAGCAFVAIHDGIAVMHAVEVSPNLRRSGAARNMSIGAADWARRQGAERFAILTVRDNGPAQGLYASLGMVPVEHYHYRRDPDWTETP